MKRWLTSINLIRAADANAKRSMYVDLFQVCTHGSLCYICRPFEGMVFKYPWATSTDSLKYPLCPRELPFHFICTHSKSPYVIDYNGDKIPTQEEMKLLSGSNEDLYKHMIKTDKGNLLVQASKQGFLNEYHWNNEFRKLIQLMNGKSDEEILEASKLLRGQEWRKKNFIISNPPIECGDFNYSLEVKTIPECYKEKIK
jgi:hypothetical protein